MGMFDDDETRLEIGGHEWTGWRAMFVVWSAILLYSAAVFIAGVAVGIGS